MTQEIRDPVSRVRQSFAMQGESLVVDNWLEAGGVLPAHYHPQQEERWSVLDATGTRPSSCRRRRSCSAS